MNKLQARFKINDDNSYASNILTTEHNIQVTDMGEYFSIEISDDDGEEPIVARVFVPKHSLLYLLVETDGN